MQKNYQNLFDFNDTIVEPANDVRHPKNTKTKLLKDLNKASNLFSKQEKNIKVLSNQKGKDVKISKQRTRNNTPTNEIDSLLQKAIPGAKILKGEWKDHKLHGDFIIKYDNGNVFTGRYQNDLRVEGKMVYKQANCEYEGFFFAEKFSGYGKLTYYGGRTIEGEWDSIGLVGNGTITYPNGDVYYGPVDQKLYKHGAGYLFFKNGYKYIGSFKKGSISGCGSYFKDEKLIVKGIWQKGKLVREINDSAITQDFEMEDLQPGESALKESTHSINNNNLRFDMTKQALEQIIKAFAKKKSNDHMLQNQKALLASRRIARKSSDQLISQFSLSIEQ